MKNSPSALRLKTLNRTRERISALTVRLKLTSRLMARIRLYLFIAAVALAVLLQYIHAPLAVWIVTLGAVIAGFIFVTIRHSRIKKKMSRNLNWMRYIHHNIARMRLDWKELPPFETAKHPYNDLEEDLKLTGDFSLISLIDLSISHQGTEQLRQWLLKPRLDAETIISRQKIVEELRTMTAFRRKLYLKAKEISATKFSVHRYLEWLDRQDAKSISLPVLIGLILLTTLNAVLIALSAAEIIPNFWIAGLTLYGIIFIAMRRRNGQIIKDTENLEDEVRITGELFTFLEKYPYRSDTELSGLCSVYQPEKHKPTVLIRKINRVINMVGFRRNPLLGVILNLLTPYDFICARIIRDCKTGLRLRLPQWMNTLHRLEALISLANFAYVNPEYTFPSFATGIDARDLGHPLIDPDKKITNDFNLHDGEIHLITGSNMSGKSTFLKTLGVNLVLAYAGAPVNASRMNCGLYRLRTCIRVVDSLEEGFSFFYAEVKRLKSVLDAMDGDGIPVFFLIDEIFKGTNNRERLSGSRNYIRELVNRNATGLLTTHDLELVQLEEQWSAIRNFHFVDRLEDDRLKFDYRIKPGPCQSTNALRIMEIEGIPIEEE